MSTHAKNRNAKTYLPTEIDQDQIVDFIRQMEAQFQVNTGARLTSTTGEFVELPETLFDVLRQVAESLAAGRGVSVIPLESKLTTQAAADFLGMSRPTLVKLLEDGVIPFEKIGRHRRVTLRDLIAYVEHFRVERRTKLRQMARAGQEAGLLDLVYEDEREIE